MQQQVVGSEARQRVVQAAHDLFVMRGFADVSMQQIAEAASITKATLYHHFRDKQDLYLAAMRMAFSRDHSAFMAKVSTDPQIAEVIHQILAFVVNKHSGDLQRLMADFHLHVDKPKQEAFWAEFPRPWHALEPVIQECIDNGQIRSRDAAFVSRFIYSAVAGHAHISRTSPEMFSMDEEFQQDFVETVLHGIS